MPKKSKTPPALNVNVTAGASDSAWAACIQHNTAALLTAAGITQAHLSVVLLEGRAMRALNKKSLGHDYVTDVITFDYSEGGAGKKPDSIDGEIFICPAEARRNARELAEPLAKEMLRYVVHGVLHLQGHDDASPAERLAMRAQEDHCLAACAHVWSQE